MGKEAKGKGFKSIKGKEGIKKMKDIFICLLMNLMNHGKITTANMYNDDFTKIILSGDECDFEITVMRNEKLEEKNDGN